MTQNNFIRVKTGITFGIVIILIVIYLFHVFYYPVDFPQSDDFASILDFAQRFDLLSNIKKKLASLFSFHNEHIVLPIRLVTLMQLYLFDGIDFRIFCYLGGLGTLLTAYLYYLNIPQKSNLTNLSLLIIGFLTFIPLHIITNWATTSITSIYILFFSFATFHFLQTSSLRNVLFSVFFQFLTTFTLGSGFTTFFIGLFLLKNQSRRNQIIWLSICICSLGLYFFLIINKPGRVTQGIPQASDLVIIVEHFFYFFGSIWQNIIPASYYLIIPGVAFIGFAVYYFLQKKSILQLNAVEAFFIFIVINVVLASLSRYGVGYHNAGVLRYQSLHNQALLSLLLLYVWKYGRDFNLGKQAVLALLTAVFYTTSVYANSQKIQTRQRTLINMISSFKSGKEVAIHPSKYMTNLYYKLSKRPAFLKQNYTVASNFSKSTTIPDKQIKSTDIFAMSISHINRNKYVKNISVDNRELKVLGWCYNQTKQRTPDAIFMTIESNSYSPKRKISRPHITKICGSEECKNAGFEFIVDLEKFSEGRYELEFTALSGKEYIKLNQNISFKYQPQLILE
ncbi:MAG: hypothetical protein AB8G22_18570 [Saprospiraceae bacterium]